MRPVIFLVEFAEWYKKFIEPETKKSLADFDFSCCRHEEIENLQVRYIKKIFTDRQKNNLTATAESLIIFNGALSRVDSDAKSQTIQLKFHPDDLASPYSADIAFFSKNCRPYNCRVNCFKNKNGQTDWKVLK